MVAPTASNIPETPANQPQSPPLTAPDAAPTHTAARPPLSPADAALLSAILNQNIDLPALACLTNLDLAILIDFTDRPDIKPRIESYQRLRLASANDKLLTFTTNTRIESIQHLSELIRTTDNPIEKRRALDLILRYTGPISPGPTRRTTAPRSDSHPSPNSSPSHPDTERTPRPPRTTSTPSSHPTSPPSPPQSSDPADLATHIETLLTPEKKHAETLLPSLHACFAPRALFNKHPVPSDPSAFAKSVHPDVTKLLCLPATLIECTTKATDPNSHTESLWLIPHRGPQYIVTFTLTRETTDSPWKLHTLDTT